MASSGTLSLRYWKGMKTTVSWFKIIWWQVTSCKSKLFDGNPPCDAWLCTGDCTPPPLCWAHLSRPDGDRFGTIAVPVGLPLWCLPWSLWAKGSVSPRSPMSFLSYGEVWHKFEGGGKVTNITKSCKILKWKHHLVILIFMEQETQAVKKVVSRMLVVGVASPDRPERSENRSQCPIITCKIHLKLPGEADNGKHDQDFGEPIIKPHSEPVNGTCGISQWKSHFDIANAWLVAKSQELVEMSFDLHICWKICRVSKQS